MPSASRSDLEESRSAGNCQTGGGDERTIMASLRGPGRLNLQCVMGRTAKIDAIELPLVGQWLACDSLDMKDCRGTSSGALSLRVLGDEWFVWATNQDDRWRANSADGNNVGNSRWNRAEQRLRLDECPIFPQREHS